MQHTHEPQGHNINGLIMDWGGSIQRGYFSEEDYEEGAMVPHVKAMGGMPSGMDTPVCSGNVDQFEVLNSPVWTVDQGSNGTPDGYGGTSYARGDGYKKSEEAASNSRATGPKSRLTKGQAVSAPEHQSLFEKLDNLEIPGGIHPGSFSSVNMTEMLHSHSRKKRKTKFYPTGSYSWDNYPTKINSGKLKITYASNSPHSTAKTGYIDTFITKNGTDFSKSLTWNDFEPVPIHHWVPQNDNNGISQRFYNLENAVDYEIDLPENSIGKQVLLQVWVRGHRDLAVYSCADVIIGDFGDEVGESGIDTSRYATKCRAGDDNVGLGSGCRTNGLVSLISIMSFLWSLK